MPESPTPNDSDLPADFDSSSDETSASRPGLTPKAFVLRKQALPDFNDRLNKLAQTPAPKVPSIKEMRPQAPAPAPSSNPSQSPTPEPASQPSAPSAAETPKRVLRPRPEVKVRSSGLPSLKDYAKVLDSPLPPPDPEASTDPVAPSPEPVSSPKPVSSPDNTIASSVEPVQAPKAVPTYRPAAPTSPAASTSQPAKEVEQPAAPAREFKLRSPVRPPESSPVPAPKEDSAPALKATPPKSLERPVPLPPRDPDADSALFDAVVDANFSFVEEPAPPPHTPEPSPAPTPSVAKNEPKPSPASGGRMSFKSRVEKTENTPAPEPVAPPPPPPPTPVAKPGASTPLPASESDASKPRLGLRNSAGGDQSASAQRISLPRQSEERGRPAGKPLHEQFDLNSLVAGDDAHPSQELPPPPPGGRRSSFTIKARPSPKADDAHDTVAEAASPQGDKGSSTPPVIYPRTSGTLPPIGRTQNQAAPADPTRAPFPASSPTSKPFPAPAPAKSAPVGKIAALIILLVGVGGYFGYDALRSKFTSEPTPENNALLTPPSPVVPPPTPPLAENKDTQPATSAKDTTDPATANQDTAPVPTPTPKVALPPPPPPPPVQPAGIPPPAAEVPADPKVQAIIVSLSDYVSLMKSGKAEQPTLLIRSIRYDAGKTVNEEHKLRYLGVQPSAKFPDKRDIIFEDGRGARYTLVF